MFKWVEFSPLIQETEVQFHVESYQRLKKWYLMPPCLTTNILRYVSNVKWCNPGKSVGSSSITRFSSFRRNRYSTSEILIINQIIDSANAKNF